MERLTSSHATLQTQDLTLSFENASIPPLCVFFNLLGPKGGEKKNLSGQRFVQIEEFSGVP